MNLRRTKSKFNFSWIIVIALLILLYSSYFLMYIPKQEMLVTERGFRILKEYAENIHKKKDYYETHIHNYSLFYALRPVMDSLSVAFDTISEKDSAQIIDVIDNLESDIRLDSGTVTSVTYRPKEDEEFVCYPLFKIGELGEDMKIRDSVLNSYKCALVPVKSLMDGLKFDGLFENISLLDKTKAIHNSNGSVVDDISNFEELRNDTVSKTQGGIFTELEIQGVKTHVMILPFHFLDKDFYLAGMITDRDFRKKTRTINNQLITILSGILLLLLICMPILKIIFINRKERLNVKDAHNTTVSIILGTSLLALLFIGTMKYYVVDRNKENARIVEISKILTSNVEHDLLHVCNLAQKVIQDEGDTTLNLREHLNSDDFYTVDPEIYKDSIPFNEILFMDEKGKAIKAVTRTAFSNLVQLDLKDRNYFKNLKEPRDSWPLKTQKDSIFETFFIESIKSYNTGFKETAISFRLNKPVDTQNGEAPYMAITTHLSSLYDQVLPPDVSFVVVDKNGEVMYHSNQKKILHENFLVESGFNSRIEGGINYRTIERTRITYNERQWLAQVVPLSNIPLYHITLIDLQHVDNKNTRVYLFTFYFILITFVGIIIGMQIIQRLGTEKKFMQSKNWSFEWLIFSDGKKQAYEMLFLIQLVLILLQAVLPVLIQKPIGVLVLHLILISLAGFAAYYFLKQQKLNLANWLIIGVTLLLVGLLTGLSIRGLLAIAVLVLVLIRVFVFVLKAFTGDNGKTPGIRLLSKYSSRSIYLAYMFLWLISLSVIPVVTYYYSTKYQENILAKRADMIHFAQTNLTLLNKHDDYHPGKWNTASNGTGIDNYTVEVFTEDYGERIGNKIDKKEGVVAKMLNSAYAYLSSTYFNTLYRELKSPLTKDDYLMSLMQKSNDRSDWLFTRSLLYTSPGIKGAVKVSSKKRFITTFKYVVKLVLLIFIPALIWIIFMWYIFLYLADLVLGTVVGKWKYPNHPKWHKLLSQSSIGRILLVAFDGEKFYRKLEEEIVELIHAQSLFSKNNEFIGTISEQKEFIWIDGLGEYLLQYREMKKILPLLKELNRVKDKKVIIEMPFDLDFVQEYFHDYILEYGCKPEEEAEILSYVSDLKHFFSQYYRHTGSIDKVKIEEVLNGLHSVSKSQIDEEKQILADAHLLKLQYSHVWNNLSRMEKMILFDLADDGMMNFKNRFLINRLKMKGLVKLRPVPHIFSPSFQYFLKYSVSETETNELEQKLSKEGKWKNMRYLILLLLIPLVAFMFISQGTSIERVVGILTGVIALFSGAMKLMDTGWLGNASKQ